MDFDIEYAEDICVCIQEIYSFKQTEKFIVGKEYEYYYTPLSEDARRGELPPDEHYTIFFTPHPYDENTIAIFLAPEDFDRHFKKTDFILKNITNTI